jgi:polysaccharide transporter, PST family
LKSNFFTRLKQGALLSVVKLALGLIKIKILAILLGVEGIGLLSLALQFQATVMVLVSMTMTVVVINLGRPSLVGGSAKESGQLLGTALFLIAVNAVIVIAGSWLLQDVLALGALIEAKNLSLVPVLAAAIVTAFALVIWESLAFLVDRYDLYVRSNIFGTAFDTVLFAFCSWQFGLGGALFAILLSSIAQFLIYAKFLSPIAAVRQVLALMKFEPSNIKPMLKLALSMQTTSLLVLLSPLIARGHVVFSAGEVANGYLQVITALAAYLLSFATNGVWGHLHPYVSGHGDTPESKHEFQQTLLKLLPLAALAYIFTVVGAPVLLPLVYTKDFLPATQYLAPYFAAEIFGIIPWILSVYLIALKRNWECFAGHATYHSILLCFIFFSPARLGPAAYVLGHCVGVFIVGFMSLRWALKHHLLTPSILKRLLSVLAMAEACVVLEHFSNIASFAFIHASWLLTASLSYFILWPLFKDRIKLFYVKSS